MQGEKLRTLLFYPAIDAWFTRPAAGPDNLLRASSRPNFVGASRFSITAEAPRRFDCLEFGEIELDNRS
jgi:hypothetical protein